jgi:methylated-DNA-[protein]-cysteine S-methyltransferase
MKIQEAVFNVFPFEFHLTWNERGELIKLQFRFNFDTTLKIKALSSPVVLDWIKNFYYALLDYWNFKENYIKVPHKIRATNFQVRVLKELQSLKIGETLTYKEFSERVGCKKAYRAVGLVLSKNPLPLVYPCHRIIGNKGLTGYSQGLLLKQFLIYRELNYKFLTNDVKKVT